MMDAMDVDAAGGTAAASGMAPTKMPKGPRACATCARAKSRCIPGPEGQDRCERCHRLDKPCSSQTPAPPRKRKEPKPTRVAELERRLQDLTARIDSAQRGTASATHSPPDLSDHGIPPPTIPSTIQPFGQLYSIPFGQAAWIHPVKNYFDVNSDMFAEISHDHQPHSDHHGHPQHHPQHQSDQQQQHHAASGPGQVGDASELWPDHEEGQALLDEFKAHVQRVYPFAVIPEHLSSVEMREQRPFMWMGVMLESCALDGPRQIVLGKDMLRQVTEAAYTRPQKALDLLQGIQMLIAWYHYNLTSSQFMNLLFLARSMTASLGFADAIRRTDSDDCPSDQLECMRAYAATYYMVTITFTTNKKPEEFMNPVIVNKCCRIIELCMEYQSDELLVYLVRTQQISQSIAQALDRRISTPEEHRPPLMPFVRSLNERLNKFIQTFPPHIRDDATISAHCLVAQVLLYESAMTEPIPPPPPPPPPVNLLAKLTLPPSPPPLSSSSTDPATTPYTSSGERGASSDELDHDRLSLLWTCLRAVTAFLNSRASSPHHRNNDYPRYVCLSAFDYTYVFLTALRLVALQLPGWDSRAARSEMRFDYFLDCQIDDMDRNARRRRKRTNARKLRFASQRGTGTEEHGDDEERLKKEEEEELEADPFRKLGKKIRQVRDVIISELDASYTTAHLTRAYEPAPMTLADATQDLMQDLAQDVGVGSSAMARHDFPGGGGSSSAGVGGGGGGGGTDNYNWSWWPDWASPQQSYFYNEPFVDLAGTLRSQHGHAHHQHQNQPQHAHQQHQHQHDQGGGMHEGGMYDDLGMESSLLRK